MILIPGTRWIPREQPDHLNVPRRGRIRGRPEPRFQILYAQMTSNPRHGLPPRLMAHQPTRFATAQESTPSPSPGIRITPVSLSKGRFSPETEKCRSRFDRDRIRRTRAYVLLSEPGSLSEREIIRKYLYPTVAPRRVGDAVQHSRRSWQKRGIVHGRAPEEP